ncbi:MAG: hypothetical protein WHT81_05265 [Rectinemataceae bacterium]|nr:hypothetical protein [Spirochaetaceae bacterium]
MRVSLIAMGLLAKELGTPEYQMDLPEGACLADLYDRIDAEMADRLPLSLWNRGEKRFRGAVVLISGSKVIRNADERLFDGQEIKVFKVVVGG